MAERWSPARLAELERLFVDEGLTAGEIAKLFGRARGGIERQCNRLGLIRAHAICCQCGTRYQRTHRSKTGVCGPICKALAPRAARVRWETRQRDGAPPIRAGRPRKEAEHPPCRLPGCDQPVIRRPAERLGKYLGRHYCCPDHTRAAAAQTRRRTLASRPAPAPMVRKFRTKQPQSAKTPFAVASGMTAAEAIAAFLAERGATRCPTAAVAWTTAQPSPADIAELEAYQRAADARRAAKAPNFAGGG